MPIKGLTLYCDSLRLSFVIELSIICPIKYAEFGRFCLCTPTPAVNIMFCPNPNEPPANTAISSKLIPSPPVKPGDTLL